MGDSLVALGGALFVAGALGRAGRRIELPTIPLFVLAGLLFGPHTPGFDLVHDPAELELLATLGLVLLLFALGLEFSIGELLAGGRRLIAVASLFLVGNVGAGVLLGALLGWGGRETLVLAGVLGVSSSAIATKLLVDFGRLDAPETRVVLGVIVIEDLFLALYLAALQPVLDSDHGAGDALLSFGKALGFLVGLALVARYGGRFFGWVVESADTELLTICVVGSVFLIAGAAEDVGVSEAIGAFMVGLILAETASRDRIRTVVHPIRDTFAALFFFAFGVSVEPGDIFSVAGTIVLAVALTTAVTFAVAILVRRTYRWDRMMALRVGSTVLARGEFALVVVALAATAGLDARLGPLVAGYVLILAIGAPLLCALLRRFETGRRDRLRSSRRRFKPIG